VPVQARIPLLLLLLAAGLVLATGCLLGEPDDRDLQAVEVARVTVDRETGAPVVILRERDGLQRRLPIWIGIYEARSIALGLDGITVPRPNPHDLIHDMIESLGGDLQRVVITELRGSVYYAVIDVLVDGRSVQIDARPSDAIAVALRFAAPLYVDESVLERGSELDGDDSRQDA
jgi:bifunctional DNase/RNase